MSISLFHLEEREFSNRSSTAHAVVVDDIVTCLITRRSLFLSPFFIFCIYIYIF